jgi:hypothetical protein
LAGEPVEAVAVTIGCGFDHVDVGARERISTSATLKRIGARPNQIRFGKKIGMRL